MMILFNKLCKNCLTNYVTKSVINYNKIVKTQIRFSKMFDILLLVKL